MPIQGLPCLDGTNIPTHFAQLQLQLHALAAERFPAPETKMAPLAI